MSRIASLVAALGLILSCSGNLIAADAPQEPHIAATAQASLERALRGPTAFDFAETPLTDVVDYIASKHDINMLLDNKGLTDAAVDPSAPVTKSIRKPIRLASALKLILEEFDLTYTIRDDVLLVTSKEKADEILTTKAYAVADLLGRSAARPVTMNHLIDAVVSIVRPDSWDENGGPGTIMPMGETLLVSQTFENHEEIADLLTLLRDALPEATKLSTAEGAASSRAATVEDSKIVVYQLNGLSADDSLQAVMTLIAPSTWTQQGGQGSAFGVAGPTPIDGDPATSRQQMRQILAVRQTDDVHMQIRRLLRKMDQHLIIGHGSVFILPELPAAQEMPDAANN